MNMKQSHEIKKGSIVYTPMCNYIYQKNDVNNNINNIKETDRVIFVGIVINIQIIDNITCVQTFWFVDNKTKWNNINELGKLPVDSNIIYGCVYIGPKYENFFKFKIENIIKNAYENDTNLAYKYAIKKFRKNAYENESSIKQRLCRELISTKEIDNNIIYKRQPFILANTEITDNNFNYFLPK